MLRHLRWQLGAFLAASGVLGVLALVFWDSEPVALIVGIVWSSVVWLIAILVMQISGTAPRLMGASAEVWTADELKKLGAGWTTAHDVKLWLGDADHVVIGPPGVFVLETKWTASKKPRDIIRPGVRQARATAVDVRRRLLAYYGRVEPRPILVLWGRHMHVATKEYNGVVVIHGENLLAWLQAQPEALSGDEVDGAHAGLARYVARTASGDPEPVSRYVEVGLAGVGADISLGVFAGFASLAAAAYAWSALAPWAAAVVSLALIATGVVLHRVGKLPSVATGVVAGSAGILLLTALGYGYAWVA